METNPDNSPDSIREYYRKKATVDRYATSPDFNLREIEIEFISRRLGDGLKVLDVGCGNGYSTLNFASRFRSIFTGIDFVPEMIKAAEHLAQEFRLKGEARFRTGDVTDLDFPEASFDIVISSRCLLNLSTRQMQWQAMREIARVLKPGGRYLMLEGTLQGLRRLNDLRSEYGLSPISDADPKYNWFSNKFDESEMIDFASMIFNRMEEIQRFGMYYFISRVLHPLLVAPNSPRYDAHINEVARRICDKIPNYMDLGHVALFVFQR